MNIGKNAIISIFGGYQLLEAENNFLISSKELYGWEYGICLKVGSPGSSHPGCRAYLIYDVIVS